MGSWSDSLSAIRPPGSIRSQPLSTRPSAKISSGYEPEVLALADGRVLTGIVRDETADAVEIQDADARLVKVAKGDIEARKRSDVSLMPTGLAQGISPGDFADLIAYLETLKNIEINRE